MNCSLNILMNYQINQPYWHVAKFENPEIAQTIWSQLKDNLIVLASWGSHKFGDMGDSLVFTVQGKKFKGQVIIKLNVNDTYTILFGQMTQEGWILKEVYENVYGDQLHELIDNFVET